MCTSPPSVMTARFLRAFCQSESSFVIACCSLQEKTMSTVPSLVQAGRRGVQATGSEKTQITIMACGAGGGDAGNKVLRIHDTPYISQTTAYLRRSWAAQPRRPQSRQNRFTHAHKKPTFPPSMAYNNHKHRAYFLKQSQPLSCTHGLHLEVAVPPSAPRIVNLFLRHPGSPAKKQNEKQTNTMTSVNLRRVDQRRTAMTSTKSNEQTHSKGKNPKTRANKIRSQQEVHSKNKK